MLAGREKQYQKCLAVSGLMSEALPKALD